MISADQRARAAAFRALHAEGIFVMPCAWDAGSARVLEAAGFAAIGTTSGGVNWSRGRRDYVYSVPRDEMLDEYGAIASAVAIPASGDLENGYGDATDEVAATVRGAIERGMVGGSIEDQRTDGSGLLPVELAAERIAAAAAVAADLLPDFTLTARAESYYFDVDDPFDDAVRRANAYVEAGATCVFVPGPSDLDTVARLVEQVPAPISLGIGSGGGGIALADLEAIGVRRVSTGGALPRALYRTLSDAATEMLDDGTFGFTETMTPDTHIDGLMA